MMTQLQSGETTLACNMDAFDPEQSERYQALAGQIRAAVEEIKELPDGFAFRLPGRAALILTAAEFITLERLCCPFLSYALEVGGENDPLWLKMTGQAGVKELLAAELGWINEQTA